MSIPADNKHAKNIALSDCSIIKQAPTRSTHIADQLRLQDLVSSTRLGNPRAITTTATRIKPKIIKFVMIISPDHQSFLQFALRHLRSNWPCPLQT